MINNRKIKLKYVLFIVLLLMLLFTTKVVYAKYTFNRGFAITATTSPFSVEVTGETKDIYDKDVDKMSATIKNNNSYPVSGEIVFNNVTVTTFKVAGGETKTFSDLMLTLTGLQAKQHDLIVKFNEPYEYIDNSIKANVKGTITNVVKNKISEADLGTESNPYLVYKVEDFVRFAQEVSNQKKCTTGVIQQIARLDFSEPDKYYNSNDTSFGNLNGNANDGNKILTENTTGTGFTGVGVWGTNTTTAKPFKGVYDGGGTLGIAGVYMNSTKAIGLFNTIQGATIKNINIAGQITTSGGDSGSIVSWVFGKSEITNVNSWVPATCTSDGYSTGGIVGTLWTGADLKISNCWNAAAITGGSAAAGIVGLVYQATLNVENCRNTANITSTSKTLDQGSATSGKSTRNNGTAGIAIKNGSSSGTINIRKCYNTGKIKGLENVAGLVSSTNGILNITSSYNTGSVEATNRYAGGLLARHRSGTTRITNSYSAGPVTTPNYKGGLVGFTAVSSTLHYINSYYLNTIATSATSNVENTTISRTAAQMKTPDFATTLGSDFVYKAGTYPELAP